jgi:hypothetical protein
MRRRVIDFEGVAPAATEGFRYDVDTPPRLSRERWIA